MRAPGTRWPAVLGAAAGVTHQRDPAAHSRSRGLVYTAALPELPFESADARAVAGSDPAGIRADSGGTCPSGTEPVVDGFGDVFGYAVSNDP